MSEFLKKLEPTDVIATIIIIIGFTLIAFKINGLVGSLVTAVVFYYFGKKGNIQPK